ncbi:hypothetical protein JCM10207_000298 [Rhodosporidiobolus poonsookiae]
MDKFGSAKSAFSQARTLAESGRSQLTKQFDKVDARFPIGNKPGASGSNPASPGLEDPHSSYSAPPPPPSRTGGGAPPPPPGRGRAASGASVGAASRGAAGTTSNGAGAGVFVGMSSAEKEAFFALLDEYFSSRPHLAHLFQGTSSAAAPASAPAAPASTRPAPPPQPRGIGYAVALYDYDATTAEDLGFREGDRIEVLEVVSDDWLRGALNGKEGIFPSAYAQMQG